MRGMLIKPGVRTNVYTYMCMKIYTVVEISMFDEIIKSFDNNSGSKLNCILFEGNGFK